jgi:hypothetical protein
VLIRRSDGLLVRRIDFAHPADGRSTDAAVFAQDRCSSAAVAAESSALSIATGLSVA